MKTNVDSKKAFTLAELLVAIAIISVLVVIGLSAIRTITQRSRSTSCLSNMRNLGAIVLNYSADHNGDLLPVVIYTTSVGGAGTTWIQLLTDENYLPRSQWDSQSRSIMCCPSRTDKPTLYGPKLHYGLTMYPGFTNTAARFEQNPSANKPLLKLSRIERPSRTFLLGEVQNNYWLNTEERAANIYPHDKGSNLFFADGHIAYFKGPLTLTPNADPYPFY